MKDNRLQLITWLKNHFDYIKENQPYQQQQLVDSFEVLCSQSILPIEYHSLSLTDILEAAKSLN